MTWFVRMCRQLVFGHLKRFHSCRLVVVDAMGTEAFGDPQSHQQIELVVHDPRFYRRVVLGGDLGFAAALIDGDCEADDLTGLVRLFIRNQRNVQRFDRGFASFGQMVSRIQHWLHRNTITQSRRNIAAHYDLSNEFFGLFLDETMTYSSGIFATATDSMGDASRNKMRRACEQLQLAPCDRLVEIGTGWGALAEYAVQNYGCHVTTTTISAQQFQYAQARFDAAGLDDQVDARLEDYRDLQGKFDKLVSIEMIEAVGHQYFHEYFSKCAALVQPEGRICIQAIVIDDDMYDNYVRNIDFIRAYIFPGGCLPSIRIMVEVAAESGLQLVGLYDFGPHYAETLRRWHTAFQDHWAEIEALGFDDRFARMWRYYLSYCEAAFDQRQVSVVQATFAHRAEVVDREAVLSNGLEVALA